MYTNTQNTLEVHLNRKHKSVHTLFDCYTCFGNWCHLFDLVTLMNFNLYGLMISESSECFMWLPKVSVTHESVSFKLSSINISKISKKFLPAPLDLERFVIMISPLILLISFQKMFLKKIKKVRAKLEKQISAFY